MMTASGPESIARAPGGPRAPMQPHLMCGGCDGPPGVAKMANDDALATIWCLGNLVFEEETIWPRGAAGVVGRLAEWPLIKPICVSILA